MAYLSTCETSKRKLNFAKSCKASLGPYAWERLQAEQSPPKRVKINVGESFGQDMELQRCKVSKGFPQTHPDYCKPEILKHPELAALPRAGDVFWQLE